MSKDKKRLDKIIGANIRTERARRQITREDLADIVELTTSHIGLIERGERGATAVLLQRLSKAFNISIDSLFLDFIYNDRPRSEKNDAANKIYRKKVYALISNFDEHELEALSHTIKGILGLRGNRLM